MRFRFSKNQLEKMYQKGVGAKKYSSQVVDAFFEVMAIIEAAPDERDFYALKHLHYEKLKGKRKNQRSLALGSQFRLVLQRLEDEKGTYLLIEDIEDYH